MIKILITETSVRRRFILYFILSQMIFSLGSAVFISDINIVEGKFALMILQSGFSKIFKRDPLCGVTSNAKNRQNKCQEVLDSKDFKDANEDIIYDSTRADLPKKKCQSSEVCLTKEGHIRSLSGRKIWIKMFECPFKKKSGSDEGVYLMALASDSDTLFLFNGAKQPVGWYWTKPFQGNTEKTN